MRVMLSPVDAVLHLRRKEMDLFTGYHAEPSAMSKPYPQGIRASKDENMSRTETGDCQPGTGRYRYRRPSLREVAAYLRIHGGYAGEPVVFGGRDA